ncbi:hypothetical protein AH4AK4_0265 [Aeromonas hydrophila 4AK4]|nr:hypothetical protein AH4AK4_0265 [Aeromonas hydrophila 4AK4]
MHAIVGQTRFTRTVLTRNGVNLALRINRTNTRLQEEVGALTTAKLKLRTDISCHLLSPTILDQVATALYAALLGRTTTVVRDRSHISNISDAETSRVQSADGRLTTGTRTFDHDFQVLHAVFFGDLTSALSSYLGSKRSGLTGTTETGTTRGSPRQSVALTVSNGHDCVVERCMNVRNTVAHLLFNALASTSRSFSHFLPSRYFLIALRGPLRVRALVLVR